MRLMIVLMCSLSLMATEIKGVVRNGSGEGFGKADMVQLILLEEGMKVLGSANDVDGAFSFHVEENLAGKSVMLQANKDGVLYTQPIESLDGELSIDVFDLADSGTVKASIGSLAFYCYGQTLDVGLFYNLDNVTQPPVSIRGEKGSFTFDLIPGASDIQASTRRGTMPLRQDLKVEDNKATLNYTLKPGRTQLMVRTRHLYNPNEVNEYVLPLPAGQELMRVLVLPSTMKMEGEGVAFVKEDTEENLNLYEFEPVEGQTELRIKLSGEPLDESQAAMGTNQSAATSNGGGGGHGDARKIESRHNPIKEKGLWILAGVLLVMGAFGLVAKGR